MAKKAAETTEEPTVNETTEEQTTDTDAEEMDVVDFENHPETGVRVVWQRFAEALREAQTLADKYKKGQPPSAAALDDAVQSSENPAIAALRKEIDDIERQITQLHENLNEKKAEARELAKEEFEILPEEELRALKGNFAQASVNARERLNVLVGLCDALGDKAAVAAAKEIILPRLDGSISTPKEHSSRGVSRISVEKIVVRKGDDFEKEFDKFTSVRVLLKVDSTGEIHAEWLKAAGVDDFRKVTEPVTFEMNGYEVTVYPNRKGRKEGLF